MNRVYFEQVYAALKAKSELYEQLSTDQGISEKARNAFLVNFASKDRENYPTSSDKSSVKATPSSSSSLKRRQEDIESEDDHSDIEDQFGRIRRVHRASKEYINAMIEREEKIRSRRAKIWSGDHCEDESEEDNRKKWERRGKDEIDEGRSKISGSQWAWSRGQHHDCDGYGEEESRSVGGARAGKVDSDATARLLLTRRVESEISQVVIFVAS